MICTSIYRNLLDWINGLFAAHTFVSGACKQVGDFLPILIISLLLRFHDLWCSFETLVETAGSLEKLIIMRLAIQNPLERIVVAQLECTSTMVAPETGLVVGSVICCQLINKVDSFCTGHAFLLCSSKCCHLMIWISHKHLQVYICFVVDLFSSLAS